MKKKIILLVTTVMLLVAFQAVPVSAQEAAIQIESQEAEATGNTTEQDIIVTGRATVTSEAAVTGDEAAASDSAIADSENVAMEYGEMETVSGASMNMTQEETADGEVVQEQEDDAQEIAAEEQEEEKEADEEEESKKAAKKEKKTKKQTVKKNYTNADVKLLACLIYAEAGNQSYNGKLAVANVVLSRVKSNLFPNTMKEVIYQSAYSRTYGRTIYQFSVAAPSVGTLKKALDSYGKRTKTAEIKAEEECIKAAKAALEGKSAFGEKEYLFFCRYSSSLASRKPNGVKIGAHYFYR